MNTASGGATASNSNQVALTASPVTTINEVYDAYLEFLTLPGSLQVSDSPPPKGVAQICKKCGGQYYWVPIQYRKQFLGLALRTTAQRGKPLLPLDEFFTVKIMDVVGQSTPEGTEPIRLTIKFDKKVPNDAGYLEITEKDLKTGADLKYKLEVREFIPSDKATLDQTEQLIVIFNTKKTPPSIQTVDDLKRRLPLQVNLYLNGHRPLQPPSTNDLLDRVNFQLQQIQFNQLRSGGP